MSYHVQITRDDLHRLELLPHVSAEKLTDVLDQVESYLSDVTDAFRDACRLAPGSPYFRLDFVFQDEGHGHQLLIYVDDSHAAAGVLVVAFIDHKIGTSI